MTRAAGGKPEILRRLSGKLEKNKLKKIAKTYKNHPEDCVSAQKSRKERKRIDNFCGWGYYKVKHFRKMSENKKDSCHKRHGPL